MTAKWDHLPVEMMQTIVEELDVRTRVKLSMCSKFQNQLVRSTKRGKIQYMRLTKSTIQMKIYRNCRKNGCYGVLIQRLDGGCVVRTNVGNDPIKCIYKYWTTTDWKEIVLNIMSLVGTKAKMKKFQVNNYRGFKEHLKWFRNNFRIEPENFAINLQPTDSYDEIILDWPSNVRIGLDITSYKLPNLEYFNAYEQISWLWFDDVSENGDAMTDEDLKKMTNLREIKLYYTNVTLDGFEWWIKKWFNEKDGYYYFKIKFKEEHEFSVRHFKRKLADVIEKAEQYFEDPYDCWKIKNNENVEGVIKLLDEYLIFSSGKDDYEENEQEDENGNNNDGAIAQAAENGNLLINDVDRDVEMGNVPRRKKSSMIIIIFLHFFSFFLPLTFPFIFCLLYQKINL